MGVGVVKSLKTMHEIMTEVVRSIGPRIDRESGRFGYYATIGQIREVYFNEGFSMRSKKTIPSHIEAWAYIGFVGYDEGADLSDDATTIWWPCMSDKTALTLAAERILADPSKLVLDPPKVNLRGD